MTEPFTRGDPPENVRELPVTTDPGLSPEEREVRIVGSADTSELTCSTEVPTVIKWLQSIPAASFEWVRRDREGAIVACHATIPRGVVKLQATERKSDQFSQMVSYGELRE